MRYNSFLQKSVRTNYCDEILRHSFLQFRDNFEACGFFNLSVNQIWECVFGIALMHQLLSKDIKFLPAQKLKKNLLLLL